MGSLELLISTNGTAWTSLWSLSGNQGNTWYARSINLAAYAGQTVMFRFKGRRGTGYEGDAAIDNIKIYGHNNDAGPHEHVIGSSTKDCI